MTHDTQTLNWEVVYVHGFGGKNDNPPFVAKTNSFLAKKFTRDKMPLTVRTHSWDSVGLAWWECERSLCQKWTEAKNRAEVEGSVLWEREIADLEHRQQPYILIGFSLGAYVVLQALAHCERRLQHLQAVILLGAAVPRSYRPNPSLLPERFQILNYHSPVCDHVLKDGFRRVESESAGGELGFGDPSTFQDRRVGCTHVHKKGGLGVLHFDYSQLAVPLAYLCLWKQGVMLNEGEPRKHWGWWPMTKWELWWNEIYYFEQAEIGGESGPVLIQHNKWVGHFRAGTRSPTGGGWRPFLYTRNLHSILKAIGV